MKTPIGKTGRIVKELIIKARGSRLLIGFLSVSLFIIIWEILPRWNIVDAEFISQPSRVVQVALDEIFYKKVFFDNLYVSLIEFSVGFSLAVVFGVPLGLLIGSVRKIRYLLDPPIMALWSTPRLALIPIFIIWLGIGMESKIAVAFVGAIIPIIVNAVAGIREVDFILTQAARAFGAKQRDIFIKILLPGCVPALMTGLRLGLGRAIMGMVVGEMYVSQKGIGNQIMSYGEAFRMDQVIFYVVVVCLLGVSATNLMRSLENRLQNWRVSE